MCILLFVLFSLSFVASPSVLWYCWLGLLTYKNSLPYNLYCVGGDVKHCTIQSNLCLSLWTSHRGLQCERLWQTDTSIVVCERAVWWWWWHSEEMQQLRRELGEAQRHTTHRSPPRSVTSRQTSSVPVTDTDDDQVTWSVVLLWCLFLFSLSQWVS